ncbi:two-on-two hemoglobin-3-like [Dendrobium catenatum]|uniref:two-on-two hemoglobin-3-like n=1 Tax=Dendrobium catenatum TaxID=906689 RepID=UPI00109F7D67|nr:two-on-two hemoglobin-3-like [Dendrobium catenatum]
MADVAEEMQSLQEKASVWSGVAASDAFAIDETNVFNAVDGDIKPFLNLSTNFYNRVYDDEWFRSIFAWSRKEDAIQN